MPVPTGTVRGRSRKRRPRPPALEDKAVLKRAAARVANHEGSVPSLLPQGSKRLKRASKGARRARRRGTANRYRAQPNAEGRDSPTRA